MKHQSLRIANHLFTRPTGRTIRTLLAAAVFFNITTTRGDEPTTRPSDEIAVKECLVIKPVGKYGRSAVHTDAVEARLVAGSWSTPKEGDTVTLADGSYRTWEQAKAGEDGWIRREGLAGGYASAAIAS